MDSNLEKDIKKNLYKKIMIIKKKIKISVIMKLITKRIAMAIKI